MVEMSPRESHAQTADYLLTALQTHAIMEPPQGAILGWQREIKKKSRYLCPGPPCSLN